MILPKAIFSDGSRVRSSSSRRWRAAIALWNAATSRIRKKPRRKIGRQHETKRRQEGQHTAPFDKKRPPFELLRNGGDLGIRIGRSSCAARELLRRPRLKRR